jgi:amino acid adenylation domain-containing protein
MLVEELQPERNLSHTPLFQVMFVLQNAPLPDMRLPGLEVRQVEIESNTAKFDLTLFMKESAEGLIASWEYNTDRFDQATIKRMMGNFETLLAGIVEDADRCISRLPLLSQAERHLLLHGWNQTTASFPSDLCLHQLFSRQARLSPHAPALIGHNTRPLSYQQLERRSNQLARHLRARGVGPESIVALLVQRSPEMLVALLGILKAGGAYLPLDPSYPAQRLSLMLEDAQARLLLTDQGECPDLALAGRLEVLALDQHWQLLERQSEEAVSERACPGNLAYLIYTSGSTGRPKAVAITHRCAVAMVDWASKRFRREALSGVLASTSICFDLSIFELFVPLSCGGQVILAANALELATHSEREQVRLINTVPSAMSELLQMGAVPQSVRVVNLAGEALTARLVERLYAEEQIEEVFNLYGPSEDTTYSTAQQMGREPGAAAPPIGRPISNTQAYVLDEVGELAPIGARGELYLGGEGLARGYLGRPELTAERFVPDGYGQGRGGRLYRTGDLVRYGARGELEYLGRADNQVKVRGYRIELGEVEAVLCRHRQVKEAVVAALGRVRGAAGQATGASGEEVELVGYVVAVEGQSPTGGELRAYLRQRLPEYMVPVRYLLMEQLPRTPNGKVDRRALVEVGRSGGGGGGMEGREVRKVRPRTEVERRMARVWEEVLGVEEVGVEDNFFELGGHSLVATRLMWRVGEEFKVEMSLRSLFESPSIAALTVKVLQHQAEFLDETEIEGLLIELEEITDDTAQTLLTKQVEQATEINKQSEDLKPISKGGYYE